MFGKLVLEIIQGKNVSVICKKNQTEVLQVKILNIT